MTTNLDKIKTKIAAMMTLSKDRAATEAEAANALRKARELMSKYSLTMKDLASGKVERSDFIYEKRDVVTEIDRWSGMAIGRFCDVVVVNDKTNGGVVFYGYGVDVALAGFIRDVLIETGNYEWKLFEAGLKGRVLIDPKTKQAIDMESIRLSFLSGFTDRVNERMNYIKKVTTGTDLIVLKSQLIQASMGDGGDMKPGQEDNVSYLGPDEAGRKAGDKAKINREMGGKSKQKRLK